MLPDGFLPTRWVIPVHLDQTIWALPWALPTVVTSVAWPPILDRKDSKTVQMPLLL